MTTKGSQQSKMSEFIHLTNASDSIAQRILKASGWNVQRAVNEFFEGGYASTAASSTSKKRSGSSADKRALEKLFQNYVDPDDASLITVEGMERLCRDLAVDPSDPVMLVIAYHLKAKRMCEFTKQGWLEGWTSLGCDSLQKMKDMLDELRQELSDPIAFKDVYLFTFAFALDENQKSLPLDTALPLWQLLLKDKFPLLDRWISFVQESHGKAISKDTWNLLLDFITELDKNLEKYDPDGAWPVLIDEFAEMIINERNNP